MRYQLMSVGEFQFLDEPVNKGLIGGKIIAVNPDTGEETSKPYKRFHTGKTNKFEVLARLISEVVPPPPEEEEKQKEEENSTEEEHIVETIEEEA